MAENFDTSILGIGSKATSLLGKPDFQVGTISRNILANRARDDAEKKKKQDKLDKLTEFDTSKAAGLYPMWASQYVKGNTDFVKQVYKVADEQGIDAAERFAREKAPALAAFNSGLFTNNNTFKETEKQVAEGKIHEGNMRDMSLAARNAGTPPEQWQALTNPDYGYSTTGDYGFTAAPRQKVDVPKIFQDANKNPSYSSDNIEKGQPITIAGGKLVVPVTPIGTPSLQDVSEGVHRTMSDRDAMFNYTHEVRPHLPESMKEKDFETSDAAKISELTKFGNSIMSVKGKPELIPYEPPRPSEAEKKTPTANVVESPNAALVVTANKGETETYQKGELKNVFNNTTGKWEKQPANEGEIKTDANGKPIVKTSTFDIPSWNNEPKVSISGEFKRQFGAGNIFYISDKNGDYSQKSSHVEDFQINDVVIVPAVGKSRLINSNDLPKFSDDKKNPIILAVGRQQPQKEGEQGKSVAVEITPDIWSKMQNDKTIRISPEAKGKVDEWMALPQHGKGQVKENKIKTVDKADNLRKKYNY